MEEKRRASEITLRLTRGIIQSAYLEESQRAGQPAPPRWPKFEDDAGKKALLIKGIGSTSADRTLDPLIDTLRNYSPCEYSYKGKAQPTYAESDSINALFRPSTIVDYLNEYFAPQDDSDRLILAHSLGGVIAYQWAWNFRAVNSRRPGRTALFLIASPTFVQIPRTGHTLTWRDRNGEPVSRLIRGTTYAPHRVPGGLSMVGSCFCERDPLALPAVCRLPVSARSTNYDPIGDAEHMTICRHENTKGNLADFLRRAFA